MQTVDIAQIQLPPRPQAGHKGTFGRVLVIGGSVGMSGSISLSATAALRAGAGLVTVAVPEAIQSIVSGFEPSYTTVGLPCESSGQLAECAADQVNQLVAGHAAIGIGPGLGQSPAAARLLARVLEIADCPVILDADALNLVASHHFEPHLKARQQVIITPHPGEFSRLTGLSPQEIGQQRVAVAAEYAQRLGVVVLLKGAGTVVTDGQRVCVNTTGNSGMATGGTGDVLTGLLTALAGQQLEPFAAGVLAAHLHGLAGDFAAKDFSQPGLIASDLLPFLGKAWLRILRDRAD